MAAVDGRVSVEVARGLPTREMLIDTGGRIDLLGEVEVKLLINVRITWRRLAGDGNGGGKGIGRTDLP